MRILIAFVFLLIHAAVANAGEGPVLYQKPAADISKIVEAEPFPAISVNHEKSHLLKCYYNNIPPISFIARPKLRLAGLRFIPRNRSTYRSYFYTRVEVLDLKTRKTMELKLPKKAVLGYPRWSPNSKRFAMSVETTDCVELWHGGVSDAKMKKFPGLCLNTIMGAGILWLDNERIIVRKREETAKEPDAHFVAKGPNISETLGKIAQNRTYQDLLKNKQDEELFRFYATSQLAIVNLKSGKIRQLGPKGIFASYSLSPDRKFLRVHRIKEPFSYVVPYYYFAKDVELWDLNGKLIRRLASLPVFDSIPIHGVPTGPRNFEWIPNEPSALIYAEALDKGDWNVKVPHRDQLIILEIDGKQVRSPRKLYKTKNRFSGAEWLENSSELLIYDYERDKKWVRALKADYKKTKESDDLEVFWSYSARDDYNRPGRLVKNYNKFDRPVAAVLKDALDKRWIFTFDKGSTPKGDYPYLRKVDLATGEKVELFRSKEGTYESFQSFADKSYQRIITQYQTSTASPNLFIHDLRSKKSGQLTHEKNPAEIFRKVRKKMLTWKREDGTSLSGLLYYPLNYEKGKKYPTVVSAYPIEYTDTKTAGQVRGSSNKYSRPYRASHLYFTLRGYAVLDRAQMPIVGHPENMNDTFIEQIKMNADSIKKALEEEGITDTGRIGVVGHSYGAFMVANLLTHSGVFKTGIARSGAYNRTLTPYGFQSERRPFWKAKETYLKVSPFMSADKLKKPILLIHGAIDNNSGTHTMQSKRYFSALKGTGVTARLVLLPHESHGYAGIESVNHVLWEMFRWFDLYLQ